MKIKITKIENGKEGECIEQSYNNREQEYIVRYFKIVIIYYFFCTHSYIYIYIYIV